jgi:hypothetical protein
MRATAVKWIRVIAGLSMDDTGLIVEPLRWGPKYLGPCRNPFALRDCLLFGAIE